MGCAEVWRRSTSASDSVVICVFVSAHGSVMSWWRLMRNSLENRSRVSISTENMYCRAFITCRTADTALSWLCYELVAAYVEFA